MQVWSAAPQHQGFFSMTLFSTKKSIPIFKVSQGLIFGAYQFRNCSPQNNMSISFKKKTIDLKARPPTSSTMFWWGSWSWAWICKTILGWWSCGRPKNSGNPWFLGEVTTLLIWKMRKKTSSKHRKEPSPSNLFAFLWFVDVSENSRFSPQNIHLKRVFHYFHHPFWGPTPIFWKHPFVDGDLP